METEGVRTLVWGSSLIIAIFALVTTYFLVRLLGKERSGMVHFLALLALGFTLFYSGPAVDWLLESFSAPSIRVLAGPVAKWAPAALALALGTGVVVRRRLSS